MSVASALHFKPRHKEPVPFRNMSVIAHLEELRGRVFIAVIATVLGASVAWIFYNQILAVLVHPLYSLPQAQNILSRGRLVFTAPTEGLFVRVKIVTFAGIVIASPVILWEAWRFITPGLHRHERRYGILFILASLALFVAGAGIAFAFVGPALKLLVNLGGSRVALLPRASEYLSFFLLLIGAFALTFEFPILLMTLMLVGVITSRTLRDKRRLAWMVIIVVATIVTPTVDPITPFALAIPLGILYEGTIITARLMKK
ncbi:MAG: twin-arginine translocase subunit TatC [Actinomycetota bacterium]